MASHRFVRPRTGLDRPHHDVRNVRGGAAPSLNRSNCINYYFAHYLWHGTAASFVDLNPSGFYTSQAYGVSGNNQVGGGGLDSRSGGGSGHARLWHGTAASGVDLHAVLGGLPQTFVSSEAEGIDANGVIVGFASTNFASYAVKWTPVPEPSTLAILFTGLLTILSRRLRTVS